MPRRLKFSNKVICCLPVVLLVLWGCSVFNIFSSGIEKNPDVYHVGTHEWIGDSIVVRVYRTSEPNANASLPKIVAECRSCNIVEPPKQLSFNTEGVAHLYFPEARQLVSARIHLHGSGIDTTFIQTQRPPSEAEQYFHLARPLVGRVLIGQFAPLYFDSSLDSVAAVADIGDELNIYAEERGFFIVQHPMFQEPLYLFKGNAVKLY